MKILFTGTSSFTGYWLIQELVQRGHFIRAVCQKKSDQYNGIRKKRIDRLNSLCEISFASPFGSDAFLECIRSEGSWDLLCHHAAETQDYKSPHFDIGRAVQNNTHRLSSVLQLLQTKGCRRVLLTGSVFEPGEGGDPESKALSPYGLSKGLTGQIFEYLTFISEVKLQKFVIPNPFGPYEEARFTSYLAQAWLQGKKPIVNTPAYIRDNIHVGHLAKSYAAFAESEEKEARPSEYVESQGAFTERLARELGTRLSIPTPFECKQQTDFSETLRRVNSDPVKGDERAAWDELAAYYQEAFL